MKQRIEERQPSLAKVAAANETPSRQRTRRAILDAALSLLGVDPAASLSDVAAAAEVGRTTLHRYYPDRHALFAAVAREANARVNEVIRRVDSEGDFAETLERLVAALIPLAPVLVTVYEAPLLAADEELWAEIEAADGVQYFFAQHAAELAPGLTAKWAAAAFWALLYAGGEQVQEGALSESRAVALVVASFGSGVLAP